MWCKGQSASFIYLYLAYAISTFGDRLWTFAIVFVLQNLGGGLRLVGINQLVQSGSSVLLSTYVGNWLDRHNRKIGALTVLTVNNLSVAISAGLLAACMSLPNAPVLYGCLLTASIIFCAISTCASDGEKLALTKDWITVLAKREEYNTLSRRNATMTAIDQIAAIVAPLITGYIMVMIEYRWACVLFAGWNVICWLAEGYLLVRVYNQVDELAVREEKEGICEPIKKPGNMVRAYWRQSVFPAALGLALLYMTVLSLDGLTVGYGNSQGLTEDYLGIFRAAGSVCGLVGAFSYALMERRIGLKKTGLVGFISQQLFLYLCVASVFLAGSPFAPVEYFKNLTFESWWATFKSTFTISSSQQQSSSLNSTEKPLTGRIDWSTMTVNGHPILSVFLFLCGITLSRLGLWTVDLSVTQIMQEEVPEIERGTVFGVQNAMCQLFSVLKDMSVIALPDPRTFGLLVLISIGFVTCGFVFYCFYLIKTRSSGSPHRSSYEEVL
ncbi:hypothetical protein QR680_015532 [Steinernema hermaphroditum]|uniref:Solute carrier family 40 member n=1 Tax=Steinernema hermaphroditum TaxID=289476 RepID=A0AA39LL14_9BILA|nr:hypothetical protein QR680_015532 [Steinernema hermaphroditum]